jgi:hypothetical protein
VCSAPLQTGSAVLDCGVSSVFPVGADGVNLVSECSTAASWIGAWMHKGSGGRDGGLLATACNSVDAPGCNGVWMILPCRLLHQFPV